MSEGMEFESVINGETVKLKLMIENLDIERKCDTEYHIAYTQLMERGVLPRASLEHRMTKLGIWTKEHEDALNKIQRNLAQMQLDLDAATTHEKGLAIAKEMGSLRADCLKLVEAKAAVLSNSCESLADNIRRDAYIAYATVYADTGKNVFKDYHDFMVRSSERVVIDAREQILNIATKSFQDALTSLPEVDYIRNIEKRIQADEDNAAKKVVTATAVKKKTKARKVTKRMSKSQAIRIKKSK